MNNMACTSDVMLHCSKVQTWRACSRSIGLAVHVCFHTMHIFARLAHVCDLHTVGSNVQHLAGFGNEF